MSLASRSIDRPKLYRFAGDSLRLALLLVDPDTGAPFDPTGQVLLFTLKDDPTADDTAAIVQKISTVGGFTVTAAAAGAVDLQLVPADLAQLVVGVAYECDVQAQDAGTGAVKTVARFTLTLSQDVTRLTSL